MKTTKDSQTQKKWGEILIEETESQDVNSKWFNWGKEITIKCV